MGVTAVKSVCALVCEHIASHYEVGRWLAHTDGSGIVITSPDGKTTVLPEPPGQRFWLTFSIEAGSDRVIYLLRSSVYNKQAAKVKALARS
jgi:hypothetical protein